jgi:hypothetical protein
MTTKSEFWRASIAALSFCSMTFSGTTLRAEAAPGCLLSLA